MKKKKRMLSLALCMSLLFSIQTQTVSAEDLQDEGLSAQPYCICNDLCTENSINDDCPVCREEGAYLTDCVGSPLPDETDEDDITSVGEQSNIDFDADVANVQAMIDALPTAAELESMDLDQQQEVYGWVQEAYDAYTALTDDQQAQIAGAEVMDALFEVFHGMVNTIETIGQSDFGEDTSLQWELEDGVLTISGEGAMPNYENGGQPWNADTATIKEVVIGENVTSIGESAFYNCDNLETVDLSEASSLATIGSYAFYGCTALTSVNLGDAAALKTIGNYAFYGCTALTKINLEGADLLETIGRMSFSGCTELKNINLSGADALTTIDTSAFEGSGLTKIDIPKNVTTIRYSAFSGCTALTNVNLEEATALKTIESYAFYNCNNLETVDLSGASNLISIGEDAFYECSSLCNMDLENATSLETIGDSAFEGSGLIEIDIPENVTSIGEYAFYNCDNLETVDLSEASSLTTINGNAFYGCAQLKTVNLSGANSLTSIGEYAFAGCTALTSIKLEDADALETIGDTAFSGCGLIEIDIPKSVTHIGDSAFSSCNNLVTVNLNGASNLISIGEDAFYECSSLCNMDLENATSLETIGDSAFAESGLTEIDIPDNVTSIGNFAFYSCSELVTVDLSGASSLTSIGEFAFYSCTALTNVHLENAAALETIEDFAFYNCSALATIDLSGANSLTSIGDYAFSNCFNLANVHLEGVTALKTIGNSAFSSCIMLTNINLKEATALETIERYAFEGTGLTEINIPKSVTLIGDAAFFSCNDLKTMTCLSMTAPTLGQNALFKCDALETIYVPNGATGYTEENGWPEEKIVTIYTLTVDLNGGNGATTDGQYTAGQEIRMDAGTRSGYRFTGWTSSNGGTFADAANASTTFIMPASDTTITANWKKRSSSSGGSSPSYYSITFDTNGGENMDKLMKVESTKIDLDDYVPERAGYRFVGWYSDEDLTKKIDAVDLEKDITLYAKWEKIAEEVPEESQEEEEIQESEALSFKDVKESDWFYDAVSYAVENGFMNGMSAERFSPNTPLTREMMVVILYNIEGQPESAGENPFTDVKDAMWYTDAILWANTNGIVAGYGNGAYGVGDLITREQFAAILYRYAQFKGYDTTQGGMAIREFSDNKAISDYARPAMVWAVNTGIISGMGDGTLAPQGNTTRAEAATMLMNFCENITK